MAIKFRSVLHFNCDTGDPLTLQDKKWDCVIPCTVIGVTADGQPVILSDDEPKLNTTELIPAGILRTLGRPGQTPEEVMILGSYQEISSEDLQGKKVLISRYASGTWLIICEDKTYIKQEVCDDNGELYMSNERLTLRDLHAIGRIDDAVYTEYQNREFQRRQVANRQESVLRLKQASRTLGANAAKAIINNLFREST